MNTSAGDDLSATAARNELEMLDAERRLSDQNEKLSRNIRLATTDSLLAGPLTQALRTFSLQHPSITLEIGGLRRNVAIMSKPLSTDLLTVANTRPVAFN